MFRRSRVKTSSAPSGPYQEGLPKRRTAPSLFTPLSVDFFLLMILHFDAIVCATDSIVNLLTPNVNYSGRTAPLTSKVAFYIFIQQI